LNSPTATTESASWRHGSTSRRTLVSNHLRLLRDGELVTDDLLSHTSQTDRNTVRIVGRLVGLGLHNTNRHDTIHGPAITVPPLEAKIADPRRPSCRKAVLDAIEKLHQRTGATQFARRDIVAEVQGAAASFERQTIYRCLRRLTGHEPGSAHHDLEDFGNDRLRRRI
jgi:hypothetical protein